MHGYLSEQEFIDQIAGFLSWYYLAASLMNAIAAGWSLRAVHQHDRQQAVRALLIVSAVSTFGFLVLSSLVFAGYASVLSLPRTARCCLSCFGPMADRSRFATAVVDPVPAETRLVRPLVAWTLLNAALLRWAFR